MELLQILDLHIQLFVYITAQIASGEDRHDFEQTGGCGTGCPVGIKLAVVEHLLIQQFQAQKCAHALIKRLLVFNRPPRGGLSWNAGGNDDHREYSASATHFRQINAAQGVCAILPAASDR